MIFFDDSYVIQDRTLRTLIEAGEERDGVYYFKHNPAQRVNAVNTSCIWHRYLGRHHLSEVLSLLPSSLGIDFEMNKSRDNFCDICYRVKQTRNPFPISRSIARDIFDLIHSDIWVLYRVPSTYGANYFLSIMDDTSRAIWMYLM